MRKVEGITVRNSKEGFAKIATGKSSLWSSFMHSFERFDIAWIMIHQRPALSGLSRRQFPPPTIPLPRFSLSPSSTRQPRVPPHCLYLSIPSSIALCNPVSAFQILRPLLLTRDEGQDHSAHVSVKHFDRSGHSPVKVIEE